MSEGPEVKRAVDKISETILGKIYCRSSGQKCRTPPKGKNSRIKSLIRGHLWQNIIIHFSCGIFLRNHMQDELGHNKKESHLINGNLDTVQIKIRPE
jgi:hypothetical protein